jgi:hypothetical protein
MKTVTVLKKSLPVVASVSTGIVVGTVLKAFTPLEPKLITKIGFGVGSFMLVSIAGDAAAKYTEGYITQVETDINNLKAAVKDAKDSL